MLSKTDKVLVGNKYVMLSVENINLNKEQKKAGEKPYKTVLIPVVAVANIPLSAGNQELWTVLKEDGAFSNVWANQLREQK